MKDEFVFRIPPSAFILHLSMGMSYVAADTLPSRQDGNDTVTLAFPLPASSGTHPGQ